MECRKIVRRGSLKRKVFTGAGVGESQPVGMEELPFGAGGAGESGGATIKRIAGHGATGCGRVDPNLMGAASQQLQFQ